MGIMDKLNYYSQFKKENVYKRGAFNPGLFDLDKKKLKNLRPQIFNPLATTFGNRFNTASYISVQLNDGDIQTAVVVSTDPLLVACYTDDMDAVALQCYPTELGKKKGWTIGTRLIITCTYNGFGPVRRNKDLFEGPNSKKKFKSFGPIIADLYATDMEYVERKKREIPDDIWEKTFELGNEYMVKNPGMARNGLDLCFKDAKKISDIKFNPKIKLD